MGLAGRSGPMSLPLGAYFTSALTGAYPSRGLIELSQDLSGEEGFEDK